MTPGGRAVTEMGKAEQYESGKEWWGVWSKSEHICFPLALCS